MSVITTADEKRELLTSKLTELKKLIKESQDVIDEMTDEGTWGGDHWSEDFVREATNLWMFLAEIKLRLRYWKFFGEN